MGALYLSGLRMACRRWPVVLALFVANLVLGLTFAAGAWTWLADALDESLATRTLLTDLDLNVFVDLYVHHGASLRMLLLGGVSLAVVSAVLGVWLNATAVAAVAEEVPLAACMRRGADVFATFLRLWLMASAASAVIVLITAFLSRAALRWSAESPHEMTVYWVVGGCVAAGAALLLFFATVHDHARIHSAATGSSAVRACAWALRFVGSREPRALLLSVLLLGTGLAAWGLYQSVGLLVGATTAPRVILSLLWGETLLLGRMLLRVWLFAAATELQNVHESAS